MLNKMILASVAVAGVVMFSGCSSDDLADALYDDYGTTGNYNWCYSGYDSYCTTSSTCYSGYYGTGTNLSYDYCQSTVAQYSAPTRNQAKAMVSLLNETEEETTSAK